MNVLNRAKEIVAVKKIHDLLAEAGVEVNDRTSAEQVLELGAKCASLVLNKEITPDQWRRMMKRTLKFYRNLRCLEQQ